MTTLPIVSAATDMIVSDAEEIARLRAALRPLANVAVALDAGGGWWHDNDTIWQPNTEQRGPFDLTMGHARAARRALDGTIDNQGERTR